MLSILSYLRYEARIVSARRFQGAVIGEDGVRFDSLAKIVTPNGIKAELVNKAQEWESLGLIEDSAAFARSLVVERDQSNRNQMNVQLYPNISNELRIMGVDIRFIL